MCRGASVSQAGPSACPASLRLEGFLWGVWGLGFRNEGLFYGLGMSD